MKTITKLMSVFVLMTCSALASAQTLTFGVVPQQSAKVLAKKWSPVMDYLGKDMGLTLRFATAKDIPTFEQRVAAGEYDLAYMNPYHFTVFNQKPGYKALVKQHGKRIKGIVVVRKDSPIYSIDDLQDKNIAFPSPAAFAASIIPRSQMQLDGISIQPEYVSSHDSVYRSVANQFFPAGGGIIRTFNNTAPEIREQLKVLWTSNGFTPHAVAIHPQHASELASKLQKAFVEMADTEEGRTLLSTLNMKSFEAANDSDWDDVRGLKIKLLDKYLK